jgi:RNA polymerase sigma-70 factor (ECF subfamily)
MATATNQARDEELWRELHGRMRGFVGRRIRDPHAADDVTQEVLLRLHRSFGELRADDRLDAFAYRIARNAIVDHYRANASSKDVPSESDYVAARIDSDPDAGSDKGQQARQEIARCVEPLVARLPSPYREALTATDLGELSQVQAAKRAGVSVPGMKARVQRGRAKLHDLLTRCCELAHDEASGVAEVQRKGPCACGPSEGD